MEMAVTAVVAAMVVPEQTEGIVSVDSALRDLGMAGMPVVVAMPGTVVMPVAVGVAVTY